MPEPSAPPLGIVTPPPYDPAPIYESPIPYPDYPPPPYSQTDTSGYNTAAPSTSQQSPSGFLFPHPNQERHHSNVRPLPPTPAASSETAPLITAEPRGRRSSAPMNRGRVAVQATRGQERRGQERRHVRRTSQPSAGLKGPGWFLLGVCATLICCCLVDE